MRKEKRKILETRDLSIGYTGKGKERVLMQNLNISAGIGDLVALVGKNGSGKSTLLRTLVTLQQSLDGTVLLNGVPIETYKHADLPKMVSFVSTEPITVHNLKVKEAVAMGRYPYTNWIGTFTREDIIAVENAMEATGLTALSENLIDNISDGERQRVLIARALAQDTELLVMDEPTAFLDLPSRYNIVNILRLLTRENGKCVIYSTHDLDTAMSESDIMWLMADNTIVQGAPEDHLLSGKLAQAFKSPSLSFDSSSGKFSFTRAKTGEIALNADGFHREIMIKALDRCGISVNYNSPVKITARNKNGITEWLLDTGNETECFSSISYLLDHLTFDPGC